MQMLIVMYEKGRSFLIFKRKGLVSVYIEQEIVFLFIQL